MLYNGKESWYRSVKHRASVFFDAQSRVIVYMFYVITTLVVSQAIFMTLVERGDKCY